MTDDRLVRVLSVIAEQAAVRATMVSSRTACDACIRLVTVTGAGLTLMNGAGRGESRYVTDDLGGCLEETQFTLGEGPSVDAFRSSAPVLVAELDSGENHRRWPMYTPAAIDAGARAVFVFPLRIGAVRLGALSLHRTEAGPLTSDQVSDGLVVADVILSLVLDELAPTHNGSDPGQRLADGSRLSRPEIHQATGMVSAQLDVTVDEALVRLRAYAFVHERPIVDVARDVVARRLRFGSSPDPEPA